MENTKHVPQKVIREGKVAVLISPGYGAGWSSWATAEQREMLLFDRLFVEAAEAGVEYIDPLLLEIFGEDYPYSGGWRSITIHWVPVGERFYVHEYDGSESLRYYEDIIITA